jgi:DeoR/GlpR family transcriptional regulator of sugar metabolism
MVDLQQISSIFIPILVAIILVLVVNILNSIYKIVADIKNINEKTGKIESIINEQSSNLSPYLFLTAIAREAEFWGKLAIQRADKTCICRTIVDKYIEDGDIIVIDSGTTIDQIPSLLSGKTHDVKVYTNNLLAAISVVPAISGLECVLLPGIIDKFHGATYNVRNVIFPLNPIDANKIILAATAISFEEGPMVLATDYQNLLFKRGLVEKALLAGNCKLIIAVDWTKFKHNEDEKYNSVLDEEQWNAAKANTNFVLITTKIPDQNHTVEANLARNIIDQFATNMTRGGLSLDVCN